MPKSNDFESFYQRFLDDLAERGLRPTRQRRTVAGLVYAIESPFTPDQLVELSRSLREEERISRPTLYRTLNELVSAGLVQRVGTGSDSVYART